MTGLPIGLAAYFFAVNRPYLQPLFEPGAGRVVLGAAVVMVVLGSYFIRKIVDIKV